MASPKLPTRKLGKDGPEVTALGFGAMGLSAYYGPPKPDEERLAMLDHVYASGERFWDSADIYLDNEDLLGTWFKANPGKRETIFLATKFANYVDPVTKQRKVRNDPEYMKACIEKSLKRLGVDHVDLYYAHRIQADQPIEVTIKAMKELQDAGKIRHIGLSECSADTLRRASKVAHIAAIQVEYSPCALEIEDPQFDVLKAARETGTAIVAYSPLGRGFFTGSIKSRDDFEEGDFRLYAPRFSEENFASNLKLVDEFVALAKEKGVTPGQLVLAWLMAQGDDIIPIPGTTRIKNFDENMGALKVNVTKEDNDRIRKAISKVEIKGGRYPEAFASALYVSTVPLK
ncbi:hypothetical protein PV10_08803 [Exophiala mesophila]|uniref:NADP-dependent oxidoreductase domain-containing protein n=1 Tax=Exophiala mesophila TaxID=212818 RepID=A0A0D1Z372_EXOME|nr:uncharacterized protein PV10_08803 [Exophiala mesophila]KIV89217.1 hypothetical protein PV10_08803 [Exophiala mesophila]